MKEPSARPEPRRYAPMLATLAGEAPVGEGWLYEVKWDGFRALATMRNGELSLRSRNDNDLASRFPTVATSLERALRSPDCVVDGEIVAVGPDGRATFSALQQAKPGTTYVFVLFDLDPSPDAGFAETVQVALLVKEALDLVGLAGFPKTSGSDGIHVLVPIERRSTYDDTRRFAEIVAAAIARTNRGLATTEWTKAKRRGVLIDANQNGEGKTIASAYSVRPQAGAPVSTPLHWDELDESLDPATFTMDVVRERVARHGDLFAGVLATRQALAPALRKLG